MEAKTSAEWKSDSAVEPSPIQAAAILVSRLIADAIAYTRSIQPNQYFREVGDILATSELSVASPWLNRSGSVQLQRGITDEAYEKIPEQILSLLRPDSVGSIGWTNDQIQIQFTGFDGYLYAVEASPDLQSWAGVSTNSPTDGVFSFTDTINPDSGQKYYRSVLLP